VSGIALRALNQIALSLFSFLGTPTTTKLTILWSHFLNRPGLAEKTPILPPSLLDSLEGPKLSHSFVFPSQKIPGLQKNETKFCIFGLYCVFRRGKQN